MSQHFEYGYGQVKQLTTQKTQNQRGQTTIDAIVIEGQPFKPSKRFWTSIQVRFGFSANIFRYFSPEEVFERISERSPNDHIRWCIERHDRGPSQLLAVTNPTAPVIRHDDLLGLLKRHGGEDMSYHNGVVRSLHTPRLDSSFAIAGDAFRNKYVVDTPIDGYGRPSIYLSLVRQICSNGAVAYTPAFRSELSLGRGEDGVQHALTRALDGFNNEEGYSALQQRFDAASRSWASVREASRLRESLVRLQHNKDIPGNLRVAGTDGAAEPLLQAFHRVSGDLTKLYGLANLDALSVKRQRTLPTACKVYDLLNLASELATHHATPGGARTLHAYLGDLISSEYDLEGTADHYGDWRDFFVTDEEKSDTPAGKRRR